MTPLASAIASMQERAPVPRKQGNKQMTFNQAVEAFGKAHDTVRELGEARLDIRYIDLVGIARAAHDAGGKVTEGEWRKAYEAAHTANMALRAAAYAVGYQLSPTKPSMAGPCIVIA